MVHESAPPVTRIEESENWVGNWGWCPSCDGLIHLPTGCKHCRTTAAQMWSDLTGPEDKARLARELEARQLAVGRRKYRQHQEDSGARLRRKRLEQHLPTRGRGCRQRALRPEVIEKQSRSYTFTLGCDEIDLGTDPSNTAHVVASLEGTWLQRAGERLPRREHRNAVGEGSQRRCPGATGAQVWSIKGLSEQEWADLALASDTYGVKRLSGRSASRAEGALRWAKNWARIGNRRPTCHWLTRRCITAGLTEGEGWQIIRRWHEEVPQGPGHDAFTLDEARAVFRDLWRLYDPTKDRQKRAES